MAIEAETQALPWYRPQIGPRLKPRTRELFEVYSKVDSDDIETHLHAIVSS